MEIFWIAVAAVVVAFVAVGWRKERVIQTISEVDLIGELKRRAYQRKMADEANNEVDEIVRKVNAQ